MKKEERQQETYKALIEWFRKSGAYVPESGELFPLMEACYSREEAKLPAGMPLTLMGIDALSKLSERWGRARFPGFVAYSVKPYGPWLSVWR